MLFEDIDQKIDVFLFVDIEEKPKWIAHDTAWLLTNVFLTTSFHLVVHTYRREYSKITLVLTLFATFRVLEYFTFRGQIPMIPIVGGILIYCVGSLFYRK